MLGNLEETYVFYAFFETFDGFCWTNIWETWWFCGSHPKQILCGTNKPQFLRLKWHQLYGTLCHFGTAAIWLYLIWWLSNLFLLTTDIQLMTKWYHYFFAKALDPNPRSARWWWRKATKCPRRPETSASHRDTVFIAKPSEQKWERWCHTMTFIIKLYGHHLLLNLYRLLGFSFIC